MYFTSYYEDEIEVLLISFNHRLFELLAGIKFGGGYRIIMCTYAHTYKLYIGDCEGRLLN